MMKEKIAINPNAKGTGCKIAGTPDNIKGMVDKMFSGHVSVIRKGGSRIEITESGILKCNCKGCLNNRLFGEDGPKEFRECKLLDIDPQPAADLNAHIRSTALEKQLEERDRFLGEDTV